MLMRFIRRCSTYPVWIVTIPGQKPVRFADRDYFGRDMSFEQAKFYLEDELSKLNVSMDYLGNLRSSRSTSGIIGVFEVKYPRQHYIMGCWSKNGVKYRACFSIRKYGYREAWLRAIEARFMNVGWGGFLENSENFQFENVIHRLCENHVRTNP